MTGYPSFVKTQSEFQNIAADLGTNREETAPVFSFFRLLIFFHSTVSGTNFPDNNKID